MWWIVFNNVGIIVDGCELIVVVVFTEKSKFLVVVAFVEIFGVNIDYDGYGGDFKCMYYNCVCFVGNWVI